MAGTFRELVKIATRSSGWNKVRAERIRKDGTKCRCCNKKFPLQVHHIEPFHLNPELELELSNLITLCGRCHLLIGHLDNWKSANSNVEQDSNLFSERICR